MKLYLLCQNLFPLYVNVIDEWRFSSSNSSFANINETSKLAHLYRTGSLQFVVVVADGGFCHGFWRFVTSSKNDAA